VAAGGSCKRLCRSNLNRRGPCTSAVAGRGIHAGCVSHGLGRSQVAGRSQVTSPSFSRAPQTAWYCLPEYAEQQQAARERIAKPAVEAIVERVQKVLGGVLIYFRPGHWGDQRRSAPSSKSLVACLWGKTCALSAAQLEHNHRSARCLSGPARPKVLERVTKEVQAQAALYQESVRDAAELADTTGVELGQVRPGLGGWGPGSAHIHLHIYA
jgi:hypothetical protein